MSSHEVSPLVSLINNGHQFFDDEDKGVEI